MRMTQFQLGTARIRTGWSECPIRQSGYPPTDDPHIPSLRDEEKLYEKNNKFKLLSLQ